MSTEAEDVSSETESGANPVGRPTEYRPEFCEKVANLCIAGATDFEVAESLGVHVSTLYRWKGIHPEFREALKVGKELADDRIEAAMFHRAAGYSHPAVKIFQSDGKALIVPYTEHVPPDVGAGTLWLINRRGKEWRAKSSHEITGPNGGPVQSVGIVTNDPVAAAAAYQEMIRGGSDEK